MSPRATHEHNSGVLIRELDVAMDKHEYSPSDASGLESEGVPFPLPFADSIRRSIERSEF